MNAHTPDTEALLTPAEVATMFRVDPKTVTRWAKAGKLTSIRTLGGHRRYRESEVRNLLAARSRSRSTASITDAAPARGRTADPPSAGVPHRSGKPPAAVTQQLHSSVPASPRAQIRRCPGTLSRRSGSPGLRRLTET